MLDHAVEAAEMIRGHTRADLDKDRKLNLALVRLVEIVGGAAAHYRLRKKVGLMTHPTRMIDRLKTGATE